MRIKKYLVLTSLLLATNAVAAMTIPMFLTTTKDGIEVSVGYVTASDSQYGLLLTPHLTGLPPGIHGFHLHQNPSCENAGMAAGGHWDPQKTNAHLGPYTDQGHLGDLPALTVEQDGKASLPVLAPRLKVADLKGHALMLHAGGDDYADNPPMGGGGARLACGVVK